MKRKPFFEWLVNDVGQHHPLFAAMVIGAVFTFISVIGTLGYFIGEAAYLFVGPTLLAIAGIAYWRSEE